MSGWATRALAALERGLSGAIGALLVAIFCLNLYQVGGRYLLGVGAVWIPDLTRLLFIWMVFLGTALVHRRKRHLVIDYLFARLAGGYRRAAETAIHCGMLTLAVVLLVMGWRIMRIRMDIPYTGLEIPTGYAYLAVPVAAALIGLVSLVNLRDAARGANRREREDMS